MKNNWSQKEITIFNGVLKLARTGADINKITSRQIAAAAGMGKATIYDYFSTKEEIVIGALEYSLARQAEEFASAMANIPVFADKMNIIYDGIIDRVADSGSIFHLLLQLSGTGRHTLLTDIAVCASINRQLQEFIQILFGVLLDGYKQGVLKTDVEQPENKDYVQMVFISNVFAVASRASDKYQTQSRQEITSNAYKMLIKALG